MTTDSRLAFKVFDKYNMERSFGLNNIFKIYEFVKKEKLTKEGRGSIMETRMFLFSYFFSLDYAHSRIVLTQLKGAVFSGLRLLPTIQTLCSYPAS